MKIFEFETIQHDRRSEMRGTVNPSQRLRVKVVPVAKGGKTQHGLVRDISCTSAKIQLHEPLELGSDVRVTIKSSKPPLTLRLDAKVYRTQLRSDGEWWTIVKFTKKIEGDLLVSLCDAGLLDRRRDQRTSISLEASARHESSVDEFPVRIIDYSRGGIRLATNSRIEPGRRLMLNVASPDETVRIPALVRWHIESEQEHLVGCSFINERDHRRLRQCMPFEKPRPGILRRWSSLSFLAAVALLAWLAVSYMAPGALSKFIEAATSVF